MKKAVSPLISVMLVLVFTVFIGMAISSWVFDYTKTTTDAVTETATGPKGITYCANSNVDISNVALRDVLVASNTSVSSGDVNYFDVTSISGTPTITFTGVAGSSYTDGLAGWWHFDEGSGTSTSDSSSNTNVGTLNGAAWNTSGQFDDALQFDGDDNVTVADSATFDMTDTITLAAWVNVNADTPSTYSISPISATGGTVTYDGDYTIHTFTANGTFDVTGSGEVEVLVVAGGGGGGEGDPNWAVGQGGGGAGGLIYNNSYTVFSQTYPVVVGLGGVGVPSTSGTNGENSSFSSLISIGGAGGSSSSGGSGSGGAYNNAGGSGVVGQGNDGGSGGSGGEITGGGGGGAGESGYYGISTNAGNGGDGLQYDISGTLIYYAGGGGGGVGNNNGAPTASGGLGGGGSGSMSYAHDNAGNGVANTGGGGGGGSAGGGLSPGGGDGGSGIVIIRYLTPNTFSHRKQIILNHSGALTDYQTKLNITYESEMQSDFDDIRFVTDSGVHVPYWIENKTDGVTADVWIKSNLTDGNTTIWMYYGNAGLSSGSDYDNTMQEDYSGGSGLISQFLFNEGTGTTAYDSTAAHNGILTNMDSGTDWVSGRYTGYALDFDGVNDYVELQSSTAMHFNSGSFTMEILTYIRSHTNSEEEIITKHYYGQSSGWRIRDYSGGGYAYSLYGATSVSGSTINTGVWRHIVVVRDNTNTSIYENGDYYSSATIGTGNTNGYSVRIGAMNNNINFCSDAIYDNIRFYDRALSSGEIKAHADNRKYAAIEPTVIIGIAESPAQSFILSKSGAYILNANTTHAFATINDQTITAPISAGWNHLALTYDKNAGGTEEMKLYVNGAEETTVDYSTAITTNSNDIIIGDLFIGTIDEVRIYNRTLNLSEIADTYNTAILNTITTNPRASINDNPTINYSGTLNGGQTATLTINSNNFTIGQNNITIYTDAGNVDYEIKMNGLSAVVSNMGMNNVTVKQVVAFKNDGSNCVFSDSNNTFEVGDVFSVSGCPMGCDEFLTIKAYTDCTGVFGEYAGTPSGC